MVGLLIFIGLLGLEPDKTAASSTLKPTPTGDALLANYFERETQRLQQQSVLTQIKTLADWQERRESDRQDLLSMLGLAPMPTRTELQPEITGTVEAEDFIVERLHFQSLPGLYVTGNLYRPKIQTDKLPAILYLCGHAKVTDGGVSLGNKTHYQHHGAWFARNGYVCLTIDTLQLGEIEGVHHGTYRLNRWWWYNRGYTPAGIEAWNAIRALDYLETRPEVDAQRFGVTGRSGGGASSWWVAALDERIRCAVPVAGITDLRNHIVDGCVEGHCDCMYFVNTYRWDYAQVAALVAPRSLLISNTDSDSIFPLDGVYRLFEQVRPLYRLYQAEKLVGFHITAGPHQDSQELQIHAFQWFNKHLKNDTRPIEKAAVPFFPPTALRTFTALPTSERNTRIDEEFIPQPTICLPTDSEDWQTKRLNWLRTLRRQCFGGWPSEPEPLQLTQPFASEANRLSLQIWEYTAQTPFRLPLYLFSLPKTPFRQVVVRLVDDSDWPNFQALLHAYDPDHFSVTTAATANTATDYSLEQLQEELKAREVAIVYVVPRGIGPTAWTKAEKAQIHIQRRFYLLGQTLDGMRVYDVCRALAALQTLPTTTQLPIQIQADRQMAGVALYATLFTPTVETLHLKQLPLSHRAGPYFLNVARILDIPQALALAADSCSLILENEANPKPVEYLDKVAQLLDWPKSRIQYRSHPAN